MSLPWDTINSYTDAEVASQLEETRRKLACLQAVVIIRLGRKTRETAQCAFVQGLEPQPITDADGKVFHGRIIGRIHATAEYRGWILAFADNGLLRIFSTLQHYGDELVQPDTYYADDIPQYCTDAVAWCFETLDAVLAKS